MKERFLPEHICKTIDEIEEFYWYFYPHETYFADMKLDSPELFCKMKNYEMILKLNNRI